MQEYLKPNVKQFLKQICEQNTRTFKLSIWPSEYLLAGCCYFFNIFVLCAMLNKKFVAYKCRFHAIHTQRK